MRNSVRGIVGDIWDVLTVWKRRSLNSRSQEWKRTKPKRCLLYQPNRSGIRHFHVSLLQMSTLKIYGLVTARAQNRPNLDFLLSSGTIPGAVNLTL